MFELHNFNICKCILASCNHSVNTGHMAIVTGPNAFEDMLLKIIK